MFDTAMEIWELQQTQGAQHMSISWPQLWGLAKIILGLLWLCHGTQRLTVNMVTFCDGPPLKATAEAAMIAAGLFAPASCKGEMVLIAKVTNVMVLHVAGQQHNPLEARQGAAGGEWNDKAFQPTSQLPAKYADFADVFLS